MDKKDFLSLSAEDFKRYYQETYLKISKDQGKTWEYLYVYDYMSEGENEPSVVLVDKGKKKTYKVASLEFDFDFPASGLYSDGKETVYFFRRSERQNKKGICDRTVKLIPFLSFFPAFRQGEGSLVCAKNLNAFFIIQKKESLKTAKEKVGKKGALFVCVDRNFGISCGIWTKSPTLWYRFVPIGEVNKQKIEVYSETFLQEVLDKFRNEDFVVELNLDKKERCHHAP